MENYGFFNGSAEYGEEELSKYFKEMFENGVALDDDEYTLPVTYNVSNTAFVVGIGYAIVQGYFYYQADTKTLAVTLSSGSKGRVVLRLNTGTKVVEPVVLTGTTMPALTRTSAVYDICLATFSVSDAGSVTVTDTRMDEDVCGYIRPKNAGGFGDYMAKKQAEFEDWFASLEGKAQRNIYIQDTEPEDSTDGDLWLE